MEVPTQQVRWRDAVAYTELADALGAQYQYLVGTAEVLAATVTELRDIIIRRIE